MQNQKTRGNSAGTLSLLPSKPSVLPPSFSSRSSAKPSSDQPARILRIPARRCRSFALQSLRCVSSEEGKGCAIGQTRFKVSMKALSLWAFMLVYEIRSNRTETKNPCLLNQWRQGSFFTSAAAAASGLSPPDISFDAFNLWASKRESVIRSNRTETKNPCLLNQWRQGFVFASAAAAGSRHSRQRGSNRG